MKIKIICFCFLILVLTLGYFWENKLIKLRAADLSDSLLKSPIFSGQNNVAEEIVLPESLSSISEESKITPSSHQIKNVPFVSQAPFAIWDHLHDEACEEASLIIMDYYLRDKELSAQDMENEIQKIVSWEQKNWGIADKDLTIVEEKNLAQNFYGLNPNTQNISDIKDIKKEISQNRLVIVPAAGRLLNNPNFRSPGPIYHMLVITGYNPQGFITNDVGTRKGLNFYYPNETLMSAIHDWNGSVNSINYGAKIMLVF